MAGHVDVPVTGHTDHNRLLCCSSSRHVLVWHWWYVLVCLSPYIAWCYALVTSTRPTPSPDGWKAIAKRGDLDGQALCGCTGVSTRVACIGSCITGTTVLELLWYADLMCFVFELIREFPLISHGCFLVSLSSSPCYLISTTKWQMRNVSVELDGRTTVLSSIISLAVGHNSQCHRCHCQRDQVQQRRPSFHPLLLLKELPTLKGSSRLSSVHGRRNKMCFPEEGREWRWSSTNNCESFRSG